MKEFSLNVKPRLLTLVRVVSLYRSKWWAKLKKQNEKAWQKKLLLKLSIYPASQGFIETTLGNSFPFLPSRKSLWRPVSLHGRPPLLVRANWAPRCYCHWTEIEKSNILLLQLSMKLFSALWMVDVSCLYALETAKYWKHLCSYATNKKRYIWTLADVTAPGCRTHSACQRSLPHCTVHYLHWPSEAKAGKPDYNQSVWPELRTFKEHTVFGAKDP